ncbi:glycosyltransferase [Cycloclasticus pugetii]|uniref:glycosyltransferase n=1 Tax=Cycloclasticus pugetii TaxID=34068 RepID=UPI0009127C47|nr:glycosyltransferase [Cycloclasticus pugetii]SHJ53879.1 Glycosyltransferase involved in cell wall bisynthesis [Cycloclasticus pugetii]
MNLLFISRAHPPAIGGIENQNEALARHLSNLITCRTIINRFGKKALPFFIPWAIITGLIKIRKADQVLLGDGVAAIVGWFIKLFSNKPVSCILHGLDITWDNPVYQKIWICIFFRKIDFFIAVSHSTKDIAISAGIPAEKISVIPNGVEKSAITPLSKRKLQQRLQINLDNKFTLLSLGRLVERKGAHWFIKNVMVHLPKDIIYLIAGDGPNKDKISSLIKKLHLDNNVYLLGEVDNQLKETLFTHSDLFIQANIPVKNDVEGFGITQLEAGLCGLPSISSNLEGIQDAIQENKNGWLVEPLNADAFRSLILEKKALLKKDQQIISNRVAKHCLENFEWSIIANNYLERLKQYSIKKTHRAGFSPTNNRQSKAEKILIILKEALGSPINNLEILDIGTGNGEISSFIGARNNVTSVDLYDTRQVSDHYNFTQCNELLPFKSESFDIVISNHVIEHVTNQELHINEIKRVLKNDGILYLATPNKFWPFEVHYRIYLLHYLPHKLFHQALKKLGRYKEDVSLLSIFKLFKLLGKNNLTSFSGFIIKHPRKYLMNVSTTLEKLLRAIPITFLHATTLIHPTFVFIYKKPNHLVQKLSKSD